ncbi:MAG: hypothetical protein GX117_01000 [Candidatus Hydrogenedentes bacterium]|jgi:hypothetical protein|nr:hypothetical protein [Candidatus Hydrogenedentota bacterium]
MDNKILIGFFVFLAIVLVLPIAVQQYRLSQEGGDNPGITGGGEAAAKSNSDPLASNPELNQLPLLNEMNLIGTEWQVQISQYKIKLTLASGGVFYATHPLSKAVAGVDYLEGRWRIDGNKFYLSMSFGGRDYAEEGIISGNNIYHLESGKYQKIERFR